jgi:hypothetical protein
MFLLPARLMSNRYRRATRFCFAWTLALSLCGCTREWQVGQTTVFAYAVWLPVATAVAGIFAIVCGLYVIRHVKREKRLRESLPHLALPSSCANSPAVYTILEFSKTVRSTLFGTIFIIGGAVAVIFIAPIQYLEKVRVSDDGFVIESGFWIWPTVLDIRFRDVSRIDFTAETRREGRANTTDDYLVCHFINGGGRRISTDKLLNPRAVEKIIGFAQERNIPVKDSR